MKLFWVGGVAEKEDFNELLKNGNTQIAANVTQLNYIEGLEKASGITFMILNSHYEPAFPKYKKLFIKRRSWERKGIRNIDIGFFNFPVIKYIHKTLNLRREMKKIINEDFSDKEQNIVFLYAMTSPLMLLAKFLKKISDKDKKVLIVLVLPDLPDFMNMNKIGKIKEFLCKKNKQICYDCMKYIDKYILFAEPMAKYLELNPEKYIVIEGMVNVDNVKMEKKSKNPTDQAQYIMYAGGLNEKYGVMNLVNAFHEIENGNIELRLYGKGDAEEKIIDVGKTDNRIKYMGMVNNEEIVGLEKNAKLLVNPRPTNEEYTKYSFPSKNMEYMLSGTPLLTTKLPAMPKEYYNYIYIFEDESIKGMNKKIKELINCNNDVLKQKGELARDYVIKNKTNVVQAEKILNFISN